MNNSKWFSLLLFFTILFCAELHAQKLQNDVTVNYSIAIEASNENTALAKSLEGATFTVYLKGMQSRTDMESALGSETNLYDSRTGKGAILKQYSGQKLMITLTKDNWMQKNQFYQNMKFVIDNTEEMISGIKCKKATGKSPDGNPFVIYFASDIKLQNKQYDNGFGQLPGLPVRYEIQSGKLTFKYTLKTVNFDPIAAAKFEVPKAGFRVMTYDENQQLKKG